MFYFYSCSVCRYKEFVLAYLRLNGQISFFGGRFYGTFFRKRYPIPIPEQIPSRKKKW